MVMTTPSTAATIPNPGSASATVFKGADRLRRLLMVDFHVQFHHLIQVEGRHAPADGHPQRIANEVDCMVIGQKSGIFFKYRALCRFFDVLFQFDHAALPRHHEQVVQHL
jgi:hypothetical protein